MMKDRRRYRRIDKQTLVSYEILDQTERILDEGMARTSDMSLSGLNLELQREPNQGDLIRLTLNIDGKLVTLKGEVVWVVPGGDGLFEVGFRILQYPKEYSREIARLLADQ